MSVTLTNIQAMELARIAAEISMVSPIKPRGRGHQQVYVQIVYLEKIRKQLTAAGIDWQAQAKAYRQFLKIENAKEPS